MSETSHIRAQVERDLARIDEHNPDYLALISVDREGARQRADQCDDMAESGRWAGPLHGMTIVVKDNIDTAGIRTTAGSRLFTSNIPDKDAFVVDRIKRAGGNIIGKATMMELAFGSRTLDAVAGQCCNPWNKDHVPGGSSGGSATAVALDFCRAALGTDTGGSVRMPSAFCGVTGLRPTHGRVSNAGVLPVSQTFDTVGPIARDVGDVARLFSVIAGFDPSDPLSQDVPFDDWCRDPSSAIEGLKIGIPKNFYFNGIEDDFASAVMILARTLEAGGAKLVEVDIPNAEIAHEYATRIIFSDACAFHANSLDHQRDKISNQVFERMVEGRNVTGVAYADALRFKENWRRMLGNLFDTVNVTLFPTTPAAAPLIHDNQHLSEATKSATRFTYGSGLAGTPGLSLPCGFDANGLPIGALFETRWWGETTLFRLGAYWQSLTDWHQQKPKLRPGPNT